MKKIASTTATFGIDTLRVRRVGSGYFLLAGERFFRCSVGRSGVVSIKREGDGGTPVGCFDFVCVYSRFDRGLRFGSPILPHHGWCDSVGDRNYNKLVTLPYPARAENMYRSDSLYDIVVVLDFNIRRRLTIGGSAIFFHLASPDYSPTEGCVAISKTDMLYLLPRLAAKCSLIVEG